MKTWNTPSVDELNLSETAFGPTNPDYVDNVKYAVKDENGVIKGYEELYGEPENTNS